MMRRLLASLLLTTLPLLAEPPVAGDPVAGQTLAEQIRNALPEENSQLSGTLIIRAGGQTKNVPIVFRVVLHDGGCETDYDTAATADIGAEKLIVIHRTNAPVEYLYARATGPSAPLPKPASISPAEAANTPLAGSDFSAADLGLDFLHWPQQRQFKSEMHLGQMCYVLDSRDPEAKSIVHVKSFIDKESNGLLMAEGYDAIEHLVKRFSLGNGSFKKINGQYRLEKMDIQDKKKRSRTELKFDIKDP
jgi:hypothetical protein